MKPISAVLCSIYTLSLVSRQMPDTIDNTQKYVCFDLKFPDGQKKLTIVFDKVNPKNEANGKGPHEGIPLEYEIEGEVFKDWVVTECLWQAALLAAVQDKLKTDTYSGKAGASSLELKEQGGNYVFIPALPVTVIIPPITPSSHANIIPDSRTELSFPIETKNSRVEGEKLSPSISAENKLYKKPSNFQIGISESTKHADNKTQLITSAVIAKRTEELKLVTEKLARFEDKSKEFSRKAKEEKNKDKKLGYTKAAEAIKKISTDLHLLMDSYTSCTIDLKCLKIKTKEMLKTDNTAQHIAVLESHRGIKQALTDLLTAIVTLGVSLARGWITGNYSLFKVNTDSSNKLKKMSLLIDSLDSPNLSKK